MKTIAVIILGSMLSVALAEPLRYRQTIRAPARLTEGAVQLQAELGGSEPEATKDTSEKTPQFSSNPNAPYYPQGWRPFGQLLVIPFAVRENLESTTTVESSTFNEDEATEQNPTTEASSTKKQELETSEPQSKPTAAYKKPPQKFVGELKSETSENAKKGLTEQNEAETATTETASTENADEATTVSGKSADLETTSEPDSEAVEPETNNDADSQKSVNTQANVAQVLQQGFFIQLPDGSFQRIVYLSPQAPAPAPFVPQPVAGQFQQLNQAPSYPFGYNPITNPRIVSFSTQYHAF